MARVTSDEVKQIINTTLDPTPFIEAASVVVTDRLASESLGITTLKEIERWLAAHFLAIRDPQKKSQSIDGASETYVMASVTGEGLKSTLYGQQALMLDSSGVLSNLGKKKVYFNAIDITVEE